MSRKPRVVIVGGGFAGLTAARKLRRAPVDVLLIDRTNHHLFQPLLYQVASAALSPGDIARPLREILRRQKNALVLMAEVASFEPEDHRLRLASGETIEYDYLIVATGARHSYFGHDQWEEEAPGLKTLDDALELRFRILKAYERAERRAIEGEAGDLRRDLTFVVVGGGPTGVEMAGALAEIAGETLKRNFRRIDPEATRVRLLEAMDRLLPPYPAELSESAREQLEELGVRVECNAMVTAIDDEGVTYEKDDEEHRIETRNVIWAAGNEAPAVLKTLGAEQDRQGRIKVAGDLSLPHHPEIFVVGDAAHVVDESGDPLPGLAPVAMQQGRYVAKLLRRGEAPREREPFHYVDKGTMATIGKARAVAWIHRLRFSGLPAWLMWTLLHIYFLIGFRNRLFVMAEWVYHYVTGQRTARLLYGSGTRLEAPDP